MDNKKYNFKTNVVVEITDTSIVTNHNNGSSFITLDKLDNVKYSNVNVQRLTPGTLWLRSIGASFIIAFIIAFISDRVEGGTLKGFGLLGILILANILFSVLFFIDALFSLNIYNRIIYNLFSNSYIHVILGNKSGNNIEFYTLPEEIPDVLILKNTIETLVINYKTQKEEKQSATTYQSNADELMKLNELLNSGVITEEEFKELKNQILFKS